MPATNYGETYVAGSSNIVVCTHKTGAVGSETPDDSQGTIYCFWTPEFNHILESLMKIKQLSGGGSQDVSDGKRNFSIDLKDCYLKTWGGLKATACKKLVDNFFVTRCKTGAAAVYLFVYNENDASWVSLSWNALCTAQTNYMKGVMTKFPSKSEGPLYNYYGFHFQERLTP
jgi:hypothetical protein